MFTTYVLYSSLYDKIYIGYSSNVKQRLSAHNDKNNEGWTKRYQPWEIIYREDYSSKAEAMRREKQLKSSRGRAFIRNLVNERSS